MANNPYVNKVKFGNQTVMDISDTDAEESDVAEGKTFYKANGQRSTGSADVDGAIWGNITGDIEDQTDLQNELAKKVITLTKAQYDALPSADKLDPDKVYYVTDYDPVPVYAELDDSTTAANKVWSSQKTSNELGDKYDVDDTAETTLADDDYFPFYDTSASGKRKVLWSRIKTVLQSVFLLIRVIGTNESGSTASKAYSKGDYFFKDNYFCYAMTNIASGATLTRNTNYARSSIANELKIHAIAEISLSNKYQNFNTYGIVTGRRIGNLLFYNFYCYNNSIIPNGQTVCILTVPESLGQVKAVLTPYYTRREDACAMIIELTETAQQIRLVSNAGLEALDYWGVWGIAYVI